MSGFVSTTDIMQIVLGLGAIVGVMVVLMLILKRLSIGGVKNNKHIQVITSLSLGPRERIVIIEVDGCQCVLGVTAHQINRLMTIENKLESDSAKNFSAQLATILNRGGA